MRDDPPDFVDACRWMFTINIGAQAMPIDIPALDAWMERNCLADAAAMASYERKRAAAVAAFIANKDDGALEHALEDMHELVHMLRALPLAHSGAKARKAQRDRASGPRKLSTQQVDRAVRRYDERIRNGEKRGAIKELAAIYQVSESTIKAIIKARGQQN